MGPSGSGKSTLLRLINHLEGLDRGEILVEDKHVGYESADGRLKPSRNLAKARAEARIGMVFQHFNLFEHLTAIENVMEAPVHVYGEDPAEAPPWQCVSRERRAGQHADTCRIGCRAGSSNAWLSRARSRSRRG